MNLPTAGRGDGIVRGPLTYNHAARPWALANQEPINVGAWYQPLTMNMYGLEWVQAIYPLDRMCWVYPDYYWPFSIVTRKPLVTRKIDTRTYTVYK